MSESPPPRVRWWHTLGRFILQGVVGAVILLGIVIGLSGPSQEERQTTARNVQRLIDEAERNREEVRENRAVVCMIHGPDAIKDDPRLLELCAEVGVGP